jgi:cation diffusion facilitator CzcD-associated flavoprotein CzcO
VTNDDMAVATAPLWRGGEPVSDRGETVCVIGAGSSGLTAIKNLRERGFAVDCYERETAVGGAWTVRHGRGQVAGSTHLVGSRSCTQFPDFPMPDAWPDFPRHTQLLTYLEHYADHFGLREHIWFGTEVVRVEPVGDAAGRWDVTIRGQRGGTSRVMRYAAVVIANGHHWAPNLPVYDGMAGFGGKIMHASEYQDAGQLRGRRVLVIGAGNAGCDIAVDAATHAARCWHSSRRGYWYAPKYLLGRPTDQVMTRIQTLNLPQRVRGALAHGALRLAVGDQTRFGLPAPDHRYGETHPIANSQLTYQVGHGGIVGVPDVARFGRAEVTLTDGQVIEPDVVVLATGYLPKFEFIAPDLLGVDEAGRPWLRWHLFARDRPTLAVVGLTQPDAGGFACAHWQSVLMAAWLRTLAAAPETAREFWGRQGGNDAATYQVARAKESSRHWFEVNHLVYLRALERALNELEAVK